MIYSQLIWINSLRGITVILEVLEIKRLRVALVKKSKRWIRRKMRVVKRIQMDRINRKFLRNRSEGEREIRG